MTPEDMALVAQMQTISERMIQISRDLRSCLIGANTDKAEAELAYLSELYIQKQAKLHAHEKA